MEGVIAAADRVTPERFRALVASSSDLLRKNLRLVTLNLSLPAQVSLHGIAKPDELFALLEGMEMRTALAEARTRYGQPELF
jgi:DNA polymerase-1